LKNHLLSTTLLSSVPRSLTRAAIALPLSLSLVTQADAQTVDVPSGTNLNTLAAPNASTVWNLLGSAFLSSPLALPAGLPGLTINGASGGSTITLNDGAGHFGSLAATGATTFSLSDVIVTGGQSAGTGGAITQTGGDVTILTTAGADVSFENNIAFSHGGVIYAPGGAFTVGSAAALPSSIAFIGNSAGFDTSGAIAPGGPDAVGGAIAVSNGVNLTATTITLSNNKAAGFVGVGGGGAIFSSGGVVALTGAVTLSGNSTATSSGGGIYSAGAVTVTGNLTANNNTAALGGGGAIYALTGNVTVSGGVSATGNFAEVLGGVIDAEAGNVAIATTSGDVTLRNNIASLHGGAIYSNGSITIGNADSPGAIVITGNLAGFDATGTMVVSPGSVGGALSANGGSVSLTGTSITLSGDIASGGNGAGGGGGVIYSIGSTTLTAPSVVLSDNSAAAGNGGGIFSELAVTVNGAFAATSNIATNGNGGAIYAVTGDVSVVGSLTASGNIAGLSGGAIFANSGNVTVSDDVSLVGNHANGGDGGAIDAVNGAVSLAETSGNVLLMNNVAGHGGVVAASGDVSIGNTGGTVTITGNAASINGGAIASGGATTLTGSAVTLSNNTATADGGGIYSAQAVTVIGPLTASSNTATNGNGGAIDAITGAVSLATVSGSISLTNNLAGGSGGAVAAVNGDVIIGNSASTVTISGNTASSGGAIYSGATTTIVGTSITLSNNQSTGSQGGAIYAVGDVVVGNAGSTVSLTNNQSDRTGGAIFSDGSATLLGNVIGGSGNTSVRGGAVVYTFGDAFIGTPDSSISFTSNHSGTDGGVIASNGTAVLTGRTITLTDNIADDVGGVLFVIGSTTLTGGAITLSRNTAANGGGAIYSEETATLSGTTLAITNNITTAGDGGAISALSDIILTATSSSSVSNNTATSGNGGALWSGGTVTLNALGGDVSLAGNSAGGFGGAIWAAGDVALNAVGGDMTFTGNKQGTSLSPQGQANAIYLDNTSGGVAVTLNAAAGRAITFFDPIENNAANGLVTVTATGPGAVVFDGSQYTNAADQWSQLYGTTEVQSGTTFAVRNSAVYGALAADVGQAALSSFTVDSDATLAGGIAGEVRADNFALNGILNIAGSAVPGSGSGGFSTFTVTSNNVSFGAGSQVLFNTYLNDASIQRSDVLNLNLNGSATSGTADMRVTNVGGPGGLTTGNGIELVQVTNNNGTTAGAFNLATPVVAGPYEYDLFHGSADASGPENWYLRSTLNCSLAPNAEVCAPPTPPPPHFRIETSLNAALPSIALLYGRNLMDTLHERVGDEEDIRGLTGLYQNAPYTGGWARLIGTGGKQEGDPLGIFGAGPQYSYGFLGLQGGQDLMRREHDDGSRDHAGVTFAVGSAHGDVTHFDGTTGNDDFQAYTLGGYWTHFGAPGWYVDMMVQGTLYDAYTSANRCLLPFKTKGDGIAGSVEAGYPFRFAGGYFIEPQAQLIYQNINFNSALDNEALVKFSNVDSLIGRIGARFGRTWSLDGNVPDARLITAWIRPNVWQEFRGDPITQFSSETGFIPFRADLGGTWGEINVGVSGQLNFNTTLFANVSYQARFDGKGFAYDGKAGVRINW